MKKGIIRKITIYRLISRRPITHTQQRVSTTFFGGFIPNLPFRDYKGDNAHNDDEVDQEDGHKYDLHEVGDLDLLLADFAVLCPVVSDPLLHYLLEGAVLAAKLLVEEHASLPTHVDVPIVESYVHIKLR